jgi:hypothetical protein
VSPEQSPDEMQENTTLYRIGLSSVGGLITALLGLLVGAAWGVALNVDVVLAALLLGALGFVWGAISFQLTPTGGVIMENRTTVNYAVVATYAWIAAFGCIGALVVFVVRAVAL